MNSIKSLGYDLVKGLIIVLFYLIGGSYLFGQLQIATTQTPQQYVQQLLGPGITVSNVTYTGANGTTSGTAHSDNSGNYEFDYPIYQIGSFSNGNSTNLGLSDGIILSTGTVADAGKNASFFANSYVSSMQNNPGDPDLKSIVNSVYDQAVLEFDFIPMGPSMSFDYVFASEEYPNWVGDSYNDIFGFFLSGPGITGSINIAQIPNTATPITINNVNNGYGDCQPIFGNGGNTPPNGPCNNCQFYVSNCGGIGVAYGGYTTVLTAKYSGLQCGQTYHIKLAIADVGDAYWDSAIMLKQNSLMSEELDISSNPTDATICNGQSVTLSAAGAGLSGGTYTWSTGENTQDITVSPTTNTQYTVSYAVGTCSVNGSIEVIVNDCNGCIPPTLNIQSLSSCTSPTLDLNDAIGTGSQASTKTYYSSQTNAQNAASPINSAISTSGTYWVRAETPSNDTCFSVYPITVIFGSLDYDAVITNSGCGESNGEIVLTPSGGSGIFTYSIDNGVTTQTNGTFPNLAAGQYHIVISDDSGCTATGTEQVDNNNGPTIVDAQHQNPSCGHDNCDGTIDITVQDGTQPYQFNWVHENNPVGVNSGSLTNLCAGSYFVTVTDSMGCIAQTNVILNHMDMDNGSFNFDNYCEGHQNGPKNIVKPNGQFSFNPSVSDGATINASTGIITNGVGGTTYAVQYVTNGICPDTVVRQVTVFPAPTVAFEANPAETDLMNTEITFTNQTQNAVSYSWDFGDGSTSNDENPVHDYGKNVGKYNVVLVADNGVGCVSEIKHVVSVSLVPVVYQVPNVFTPNGDSQNDFFEFVEVQNIDKVEIEIINRWGELVFKSDEVNFKWDGNTPSGKRCADGSYFYKIRIFDKNGRRFSENGFVTIAR